MLDPFAWGATARPGAVAGYHPSTLAVGATLDSQGRLWLAQVQNQRLAVARSDDGGRTFSLPVMVSPPGEVIAADGENRPKIAVRGDGNVMVAWTQALPARFAGNVRFAWSTDGGEAFSVPVTLNDDGKAGSHRFDALAVDATGTKVCVVWFDGRDRDAARRSNTPFAGLSLYGVQSTDGGRSFGANRKVAQHTCECCRTALIWTSMGPVGLWRGIYGTNTRDFTLGFIDSGDVRRATDDDWSIDGCPHHGGDLAFGEPDRLHLVWFTQGRTRRGLFYKSITPAGASAPMAIGSAAAEARHASVAASGNVVVIAWREFHESLYVAKVMASLDGGSTWHEEQTVAKSAGAADYPLPLTDGTRAMLVWNSVTEGLRVFAVDLGKSHEKA